ncbi:hypothetical protein SOVF_077760 [Spinacia oleracea]|nr:hypothetical protein SOVF_077760 [Spinacia oleracea]
MLMLLLGLASSSLYTKDSNSSLLQQSFSPSLILFFRSIASESTR